MQILMTDCQGKAHMKKVPYCSIFGSLLHLVVKQDNHSSMLQDILAIQVPLIKQLHLKVIELSGKSTRNRIVRGDILQIQSIRLFHGMEIKVTTIYNKIFISSKIIFIG